MVILHRAINENDIIFKCNKEEHQEMNKCMNIVSNYSNIAQVVKIFKMPNQNMVFSMKLHPGHS